MSKVRREYGRCEFDQPGSPEGKILGNSSTRRAA
jgi:hypothetical protein